MALKKNFILRGNLVDLAVAVVIGAQFSSLVRQFVTSFISPLLTLFSSPGRFRQPCLSVQRGPVHLPGALPDRGPVLPDLSAAVVYFLVVLPVSRMLKLFRTTTTPPPSGRAPVHSECSHRGTPLSAVHCGHHPRHRTAPISHDAAQLDERGVCSPEPSERSSRTAAARQLLRSSPARTRPCPHRPAPSANRRGCRGRVA